MKKIILETERLILSEFNKEDSGLIFNLLNSPGWVKYIGNRKINSLADAEEYINSKLRKGYEESGYGFYLVTAKVTGEKAGMCGLVKRAGLENTDLGFALLPEYENKGYAYEAASAVIKYAENDLKMNKLDAITVPYNLSSIKLLEKLGLKMIKTINIPGDPEDLLLYSIELYKINE